MTAQDWLILVFLAGSAGALGQVARMIVGLKKTYDQAAATDSSFSDLIVPSRLVVSIVLGFTAAALTAIAGPIDLTHVTTQHMMGFAAAGYAGADFIEGIMSRAGLGSGNPAVPAPKPATDAASAAATGTQMPADGYLG